MLYAICAVIGGTVMVCQFVLTVFGLSQADDIPDDLPGQEPVESGAGAVAHEGGASTDVEHHHHGSTWFFGVITFRTVVAALTFFGLTGLAAESNGVAPLRTLVVAVAAGAAAMFAVHWMMQALYKLRADGTVRIGQAVGLTGSVYVRIPGRHGGAGKVQLSLQNRTMEFQAVTGEDDLPTGATIVVTRVVNSDTVEVQRIAATEGVAHA